MGVELAAEFVLLLACGLQFRLGPGERRFQASEFGLCGTLALLRFLQRRGGGTATRRTDAPTGGPEAIARSRDHHGHRVPDGQIDGVVPAGHAHGAAEHCVEQFGHTLVTTPHMRAYGVAAAGRWRRRGATSTQRQHRAGDVVRLQRLQRGTAGGRRCHHHRLQGFTEGGFHRALPPGVDLDEVQQGAQHAIDTSKVLGAGPGAGALQRQMQRLGASLPAAELLGGHLTAAHEGFVRGVGGDAPGLGCFHARHELGLDGLRRFDLVLQTLALCIEASGALLQRLQTVALAAQFGIGTLHAGAHGTQFAAHFGCGRCCRRAATELLDGIQRLASLLCELLLVGLQHLGLGAERSQVGLHTGKLVAQPPGIGLQVRHHAGVHELAAIALHGSAPLHQHRGNATGPFAQLFHPHHLVAQIGVAASGELGFGRHHVGVERRQLGAERLLGLSERDLVAGQRGESGPLRRDLATGEEDLQGTEFGDEVAVSACRIGLPFQRAQLPAHLAKQVLHSQQAGLGGIETTLGLLLALAVLQHAGGFFDDAASVFGAGVQHRVDLALAHDDVLLTAHAGVAEQFLHVEETTRHAVDGVFAFARAEQDARHRDLGELDGQQPSRVVDRERHFGSTQRRPLGRTGEDDVVHLLASHCTGCLRTQHPGDGVDHVRLARPVRTDHDGDPWLQLEHGGIGERLEAFEGERFQEHGLTTLTDAPTSTQQRPVGGPQRWQRGQKQVERPADTMRTMSALPHVMQRWPARSYTRWCT